MAEKPIAQNLREETPFEYIGDELELFLHAKNWKRYFAKRLRRYIKGDVLEVGAGLGANSPYLYREDLQQFLALEPDPKLCDQFRRRQERGLVPAKCDLLEGTLRDCNPSTKFDTILYIDVLEHIEHDAAEVNLAIERLRPNGCLVVLCPAHNWLYSPFDDAIGHYRRYDKQMYRELSACAPLRIEYLDCVGLLASLANKFLLKQPYPNENQIRLWDRFFVTLSKAFDPISFHRFGKSIIGVWRV
ncbi:MAG: class I SAM-dependent methyltransferase [Rubripirellula sp.]|nr:class I SAM-dependent methyltransferase [Rubripirellula sp.]